MARPVAALILVIALAGCTIQGQWTYPLEPLALYRSSTEQRHELTVAVLPFEEARPARNCSDTSMFGLIPLMPYGWLTYDRPETARGRGLLTIATYHLKLGEDLGKAAARSFDESRLFRRVSFTAGGETREADLVLRGIARQTTYEAKLFTYGVGGAAPLLWVLALPGGTSTNLLAIALSLTDRNDRELWRYSFSGQDTITQGMYYNWGKDGLLFASLFQTAMNEALQDLDRELPRIRSASQR